MCNQTKRTASYRKALADVIAKEYHLRAVSLTSARRGFYGETWRLESREKCCFVKLVYYAEYQPVYARSFRVIDHLCRNGISFINTIVKTADGRLFTWFDGAVLGIFDWIDGENIETDGTKIPEYRMLARVYAVSPDGLDIPREDFSGKSADAFFRQWGCTKDREILSLLEKNRTKLTGRADRLRHFAGLCQEDTSGFYITHGDAGGNFLVSGDKTFLVDWDDALLAPPERDAWVMGFRDWARCLFEKSLRQQGIACTLQPERLAYYGYYMFFFWLTWLVRCADAQEVESFLEEYGGERTAYADPLWQKPSNGSPAS